MSTVIDLGTLVDRSFIIEEKVDPGDMGTVFPGSALPKICRSYGASSRKMC